jgi:glycosyltransferase involved in cell wall biosynthesis
MKTKKLIICSPQLGILPESNLGGEVYDREILKAYCYLGHQVIVILPKNKPHFKHKNLIVYHLPFPFVWPPYLFNLFIIPYLFYIYSKHKFNILRIHSPYFVGLGALFFNLFNKKSSLIAVYHHLEEENYFFRLINRLFVKRWDKIITVSKFTKKQLIKNYKLKSNIIKVVYNGISLNHSTDKLGLINKLGLKNEKVLMYLGNINPRKNIEFLIKLMKSFKNKNIKLLISGKKNNQLRVKQKNIILTGFLPEKQKAGYLKYAHVFLMPSYKEGFGLSVLEAARCGIPAVVSNTSSLKEIVKDGKTGYLARLNNIKDWQVKIEKLLNNDNLRKKMGQNAREFSKQFTWEKSARKQIEIYKKVIGEKINQSVESVDQ